MANVSEILCQEIRDVIYFLKKNEVEKSVKILETMLKRYSPKGNDPAQQ